jgi:hypothetical protein
MRESYQQVRGLSLLVIGCSWFHINVLNVHAPTGNKIDDVQSVNKQRSHRFCMERFNLKKLNEVEGEEKCYVEV